jgi:hypothetical protein
MPDSSRHDEAFLRLASDLKLIDENQASICLHPRSACINVT